MKAVIGAENDGGVGPGQLEQSFQHHVMKAISPIHDILVDFELVVGNARHLRRMEVHEAMTEVVDPVVIHGEEIPFLVLQNPGRRIVNGTILGENLGERLQPLSFS